MGILRHLATVNFVSGVLTSKAEPSNFSFTEKSPLILLGTRHECWQRPLQVYSRAAE